LEIVNSFNIILPFTLSLFAIIVPILYYIILY